ncbi:MAG TPA: hypothetical protein VJ957_00360 [Longimicrobiales bacterium]|nr:hypothetical protein [Longimicrobiales bacterium]
MSERGRRQGLTTRWRLAIGLVALLLLAGALIPASSRPGMLQLVALDAAGQFHDTVSISAAQVDTTGDAIARVPLVLAVRNVGGSALRPGTLEVNLPARDRLVTAAGRVLEGHTVVGSPLTRYVLDLEFPSVQPGRLPTLLPGTDTLWVELIVPTYYCVLPADSVPDFIPAPAPDAATLAQLRIFYAFYGREVPSRQTGVLELRIDPRSLPRDTAAPLTAVEQPRPVALPEPSTLRPVGSRTLACGEPDAPVTIRSTLWQTPDGGRVFTLDYAHVTRKWLYDLNRDSIIEWEASNTGAGRSRLLRAVRFPIPDALMPVTTPPKADSAAARPPPDTSP